MLKKSLFAKRPVSHKYNLPYSPKIGLKGNYSAFSYFQRFFIFLYIFIIFFIVGGKISIFIINI